MKEQHRHGGDMRRMAALSGRKAEDIIDFSVNVRPQGAPEHIRAALHRALAAVHQYPSPHAEEALSAAARHFSLPEACFAFGNGSNELLHAAAVVLQQRGVGTAYIVEPAFSEYALACKQAGIAVQHCFLPPEKTDQTALACALAQVPAGAAFILANPANPSGAYISRPSLLALMHSRPDVFFVLDEAFIDYVGSDAAVSFVGYAPAHCLIVRSLTKFYAIPGVRVGFLAAAPEVAQAIRQRLPAWNMNAFALACACAALEGEHPSAAQTRQENARARADLCACLNALSSVRLMPSVANYVLFHWQAAPHNAAQRLLQEYGIALRDCSNYYGLDTGTWFRAAVRLPEEHRRLAHAMNEISIQQASALPAADAISTQPCPALMIQGTSSNAGKSVLAAAFCRIFRQDGYNVAPFKAQNMSLNSGVTPLGQEMGRAQIVQAQAARLDPDARMNPLLLKPHSDTGSQVVLLGKAIGSMNAKEYYTQKNALWQPLCQAYDSLASEHEIMVLEGAGSPAEINLKHSDVVNMRMAAHAHASVLLTGDIDRGGLYAAFLGTWLTFTAQERRLLRGFIVNRFRGEASLLQPAHTYMQQHTGVPVLGTIPYLAQLGLPDEDSASFVWGRQKAQPNMLDIVVAMPRHVSNYTDFDALAAEPDVCLRPVRSPEDWGQPHLVLVPGSKSVADDLAALRQAGLAEKICAHAAAGGWVMGICGGLQMLGHFLHDPFGIESPQGSVAGLGLLDIQTSLAAEKSLYTVRGAQTPLHVPAHGYEIHHGISTGGALALPLFRDGERVCGYAQGSCWGTYLHGLFDDDCFRHTFLEHIRHSIGLPPYAGQRPAHNIQQALDRLADTVREHVDMARIYALLGL
jgi:adenosylcobyric acid synthase